MDDGAIAVVHTGGIAVIRGDRVAATYGWDAGIRKPDAGPEELLKRVRAEVDTFSGDAEQFDDLIMLALTYKGK